MSNTISFDVCYKTCKEYNEQRNKYLETKSLLSLEQKKVQELELERSKLWIERDKLQRIINESNGESED